MKKINNFDLVCKNLGIPIVFIRKIEKSLKKFNGKIYLVGGNVRDLILNKSIINHPDLVVNLDLEKLLYCLEKAKIRFLKIGEKFGSIVVLHKKFKFDVTVMRKDIKTDGWWAKIKFTDSHEEDSKRRDLTFNTINSQKLVLNLEECVLLAYQKNISIMQSELQLKNSNIDLSSAKANFFPNLNASVNHAWNYGLNQNITLLNHLN